MKFSVDRAVLLKALTHVQSVVERRNTIPILANVMIEASSAGALKLTATDMEIAVVEDIAGVTVARAGRTTAPARGIRPWRWRWAAYAAFRPLQYQPGCAGRG
jgi:DNA polymerase-3 subunit beta